ncbi:RNA polymerase sigma-I factor [Natranaerovirga pectinivora]|uniref:RNA polymerase sigma-I factor n=1 Tax=Natranaerovirga pectinivora TaxID=682400 RepID=UPI0014050356|nr:RNA polymerase sigma-I factor [Natranaerovirga pectinivora]
MYNQEFLERIEESKKNELELNKLLMEYKPFIKKVLSKVVGRYIDESDDLFSVGLLAFKDAVMDYKHDKGKFIHYAQLVVKSRSIDYLRKENRVYDKEVYDLEESDKEKIHSDNAIKRFNSDQTNELRKLEILEFTNELIAFGIEFNDLVKASPKQRKTRDVYYLMAEFIAQDIDLLDEVKRNKRIPIKELEDNFKINRKKIERGRKYIIALVIILIGEFNLIREYIK